MENRYMICLKIINTEIIIDIILVISKNRNRLTLSGPVHAVCATLSAEFGVQKNTQTLEAWRNPFRVSD